MLIPRFRISNLLAVVAVISFWLATFSMPDQSRTGEQFRLAIPFMACITSGFAAIYFRGRSRAFWVAFCVTLTLLDSQLHFRIQVIPSVFYIAASWGEGITGNSRDYWTTQLLTCSLQILLLFGFSILAGAMVAGIYDRNRPKNSFPTT
jgi:hypothetical protein